MKRSIQFLSITLISGLMVACGGNAETESQSSGEETMEVESKEAGPTGTYVVNTEESMMMWEGNMLKVGGVSLYGHNGTISMQPSKIAVEDGQITKGSVIIDMKTIVPTDENYKADEGSRAEDLVAHLSSPDFFDVENNPTAMFEVGGMKEGKLYGKMTIRGITSEEVVEDVEVNFVEGKMMAKGKLTIDRQKYNVAFEMPAEDKVLSDDLDLEFKIVADMAS
jgi:polyisoprenoid-binding protein YceI